MKLTEEQKQKIEDILWDVLINEVITGQEALVAIIKTVEEKTT